MNLGKIIKAIHRLLINKCLYCGGKLGDPFGYKKQRCLECGRDN